MTELAERLRKSAGTFPGSKWYGGEQPVPDISAKLLREAALALDAKDERIAALEKGLRGVEFDARGYCLACDGWMMGPNGATPKAHTKDCPIGDLLGKR